LLEIIERFTYQQSSTGLDPAKVQGKRKQVNLTFFCQFKKVYFKLKSIKQKHHKRAKDIKTK